MAKDAELIIVDFTDNDETKKNAEANYSRLKSTFSLVKDIKLYTNGFEGYIKQP